MKEIKIFDNSEFGELRTIEVDGNTYFVANDVAKSLGYKDSVNAIKQHCRWVVKRHIPHPQNPAKPLKVNVIPEGDVLRLVVHSELPAAEKYERWIFDEVLPSIHKHGAYMTPEKIEEVLTNPDTIIKLATDLKAEREKRNILEMETAKQKQLIGELKPKADYTDRILQNKSLVNINQIAKDYGMSANSFNKTLYKLGVQYKQGEQWLLYSKQQKKGYTSSETFEFTHRNGMSDVRMRTKWTQKGRLFLYNLLKEHGIVPLIEQEQNIA